MTMLGKKKGDVSAQDLQGQLLEAHSYIVEGEKELDKAQALLDEQKAVAFEKKRIDELDEIQKAIDNTRSKIDKMKKVCESVEEDQKMLKTDPWGHFKKTVSERINNLEITFDDNGNLLRIAEKSERLNTRNVNPSALKNGG